MAIEILGTILPTSMFPGTGGDIGYIVNWKDIVYPTYIHYTDILHNNYFIHYKAIKDQVHAFNPES